MKMIRAFLLPVATLLVLFSTDVPPAHAQVIISEVYPAPSVGENEWVEVANIGSEPVPLSGWTLEDHLTTPKIIYSFTDVLLEVGSFYIATVSGQLNNSGDGVTLKDQTGATVDQMVYSDSTSTLSWSLVNEQFTQGTPNPFQLFLPSPSLLPTPFSMQSPSPLPVDFLGKIALIELLSCPENSDEWIQLKNTTNTHLQGQLYAQDNQNNRFDFTADILPNSSQRVYLDRHIFNNDGDRITLVDMQDQVLFGYDVPACTSKGEEFTFNSQTGKLEVKRDSVTGGMSEKNAPLFDQESKEFPFQETAVREQSAVKEHAFQLDRSYLASLHLLERDDEDSSESAQSHLQENLVSSDNTSVISEDIVLIQIISLIGSGIIIVFVGIMYSYGKNEPKTNGVD